MKHNILTLLIIGCLTMLATVSANAKKEVQKVYMFGMAASFNDSIVHFTDIQEVDSAWIDTKNHFLLGRDVYSYQLRTHLGDELQMRHRTCIVVFDLKREKIEKKYQKMLRLYMNPKKNPTQHFDVRMIERGTFHFSAIDMSDTPEEELIVEKPKKAKKAKKAGKAGKPERHDKKKGKAPAATPVNA